VSQIAVPAAAVIPHTIIAKPAVIKNLMTSCMDIGCQFCESSTMLTCTQCKHGFFLQDKRCFTQCPKDFVADIFRRICVPNRMATRYQQLAYIKAFSIGSCKNLCGEVSNDCSCHHTCMLQGNCCSDYNTCERLVTDNTGKKELCKSLDFCELCDFEASSLTCAKCNKDYFLNNGKCTGSCNSKQQAMTFNRVCKDIQSKLLHDKNYLYEWLTIN